ncbi:MAG: hypothetical protein HRT67_13445 [Flavobacteriaceae bacterium]|nr:hypothetical protein [Flavobacteriaceae bacterium]
MKSIILIFTIFLSSCSASKQNSNSLKYSKVYDYVSNEYKSSLDVSDTLVNIDIVNFSEEIAKEKNINMDKVLDSLTAINNKVNNYNYLLNKIIDKASSKSKYKIFFSKPKNNYLMAEVFTKEKDNSYDDLTTFSSSKVYLFEFDNNEISKTYNIILNYN